jgi:flagellar FliL protein
MAADEEKTTIEKDDGKPKEKKLISRLLPKKFLLFGGIGVSVVVLGVVLALFVLRPMMSDSTEVTDENSETEQVAEHKPDPKPKPKKHKSSAKGESVLYAVKDIVVNPPGTGGTRFLSLSLGFELGSVELAREFDDREAVVRDALITILSSKTVAELTDARQKEIVRFQIKKRLSQLLRTEEITGVYYTDFVLQ